MWINVCKLIHYNSFFRKLPKYLRIRRYINSFTFRFNLEVTQFSMIWNENIQKSTLIRSSITWRPGYMKIICLHNTLIKFRIPSIYIATDFICAFPTEEVDDFEESLDLIRKYKFPSVFINQFYPRPGTPAARLKKIPTKEVLYQILIEI